MKDTERGIVLAEVRAVGIKPMSVEATGRGPLAARTMLRELIALAVVSAKLLYAELGIAEGDVIPSEAIKVRVDAADTVVAVWPDPAEQDGTGWRQIKGAAARRTGHIGKLLGIPCAGSAEAEVLFREFGNRDPWDGPAH